MDEREQFEKKYVALAKSLVPQANKCIIEVDIEFPDWARDGSDRIRPFYEIFVDNNCGSSGGMRAIAIRGDVLGYVWAFHKEYFPKIDFDTEFRNVAINFV